MLFVKGDIGFSEAIILAAKISKIKCFLLIDNSIKFSRKFLDADFIPDVIGTEISRLNYKEITNGMETLRIRPKLSSLVDIRHSEYNVSHSSDSLPNANWFDSADFFSINLADKIPEYNFVNKIDILDTPKTEKIIEEAKLISAYFRKEKSSSWINFLNLFKSFFNTH